MTTKQRDVSVLAAVVGVVGAVAFWSVNPLASVAIVVVALVWIGLTLAGVRPFGTDNADSRLWR
jgi:hypothetical protein